jgi:hypothetical protein
MEVEMGVATSVLCGIPARMISVFHHPLRDKPLRYPSILGRRTQVIRSELELQLGATALVPYRWRGTAPPYRPVAFAFESGKGPHHRHPVSVPRTT